METHRLCQVLPCCWRAQHKIAGLLASLFCCLSFGKAIARCTADHLFASRKKKKKKIGQGLSWVAFSLCLFFFFLMQLLMFHCYSGFLFDYRFISWCVHGYRSWTEGLPDSCWKEALCRLYQIYLCTSCDPARMEQVFTVVSCIGQRCSLSVSCEICRSNTLWCLPGMAAYFLRQKKEAFLWHLFSFCRLLSKVWIERRLVLNAVAVP